MADLVPTAKVTAGAAAGAVTVLLAFVLGAIGVDVPQGVSAAVTVLLTAGAAYLKREGNRVG